MNLSQNITDKTAIGLSLLCAAHCLFFPLVITLLPSAFALPLDNEAFHSWLLFAVIPTSAYALTLGCRQHKNYKLMAFGLVGISTLILAVILEEIFHSELIEKSLTTLGSVIIAFGHYKNFQLCRKHEDCACPNEHGNELT